MSLSDLFADNFDRSLIYRDSPYLVSHVDSLQPHGLKPTRLLCLWDFPGKCTRVDLQSLLQGIFPTQGWNPRLLLWQVASFPLSC